MILDDKRLGPEYNSLLQEVIKNDGFHRRLDHMFDLAQASRFCRLLFELERKRLADLLADDTDTRSNSDNVSNGLQARSLQSQEPPPRRSDGAVSSGFSINEKTPLLRKDDYR